MSHIAHQQHNMHFNAAMNLKKAIAKEDLHSASSYKQENLFFFQCGNVIKEISTFLFDHGKSLKATGASNGQTIAGCISTGVHGSALGVGSVQDYVVGLNIIIGPGSNDIVYLERASKPVLNDGFATSLKARIIRDDNLFNAALVSLGSFGFIHGVLLEGEDRFLLKRYIKRVSKADAMKLAGTMDFENSTVKIPGELDAAGKPTRPYHFKVFINPYVDEADYVIELIYKKPFRSDYPDPVPIMKTSIYRDLIVLFTSIAERCKGSIPKIIQLLHKSILPPIDMEATGTVAEIFWDAPYQGPAFACAVGINSSDAPKALDLLIALARKEGPVPGIYAMRFVKQSNAMLAFTKFPITCMLEIDGLNWTPRNNMISLHQFCTRTVEVLKQNNIPFTLHWGKNANWSFPGLVNHMYGDKALLWKKCRSSLLTKETAALFSNNFLNETGLSEYIK
jgi:hypothetical protein